MEMIALDRLGKLHQYGHGLFGWCSDCGSPSRYWEDVRATRMPRSALFDIDLSALIRERGENSPIVGMAPARCPRCGSRRTEVRILPPQTGAGDVVHSANDGTSLKEA
jgi:predicted nucleic-acid-binding Zn-ribbon protein